MPEIRVVAAALIRAHTVLAAQRGNQSQQAMLWEFPGGKVEPGETDAAALRRELREELNIDVEVLDTLGESLHHYPHATIRLVALHCRLISGEPTPIEHAALRWVDAHTLDTLRWAPADVPLLNAVRKRLQPDPLQD